MRTLKLLILLSCSIAAVSCGARSTSSLAPEPSGESSGQVQVYVYWQEEALADRQFEIVELGLVKRSDAEGRVTFEVPPGTYTLRSYVSVPGPAAYMDTRVSIEPGEIENVKVQDCLPCL